MGSSKARAAAESSTEAPRPGRAAPPPLLAMPSELAGSPTLSPNDHVRLLVELLRPGGADLARRWVAALMLVPPEDRLGVVESIESRIVETYGRPSDREIEVVHPPVQRDGHVEQVVTTVTVRESIEPRARSKPASRGASRRASG